jgi:hypothetical protein
MSTNNPSLIRYIGRKIVCEDEDFFHSHLLCSKGNDSTEKPKLMLKPCFFELFRHKGS